MLLMTWFMIAWTKICFDSHYFDGYAPQAPLNIIMRDEEPREGYRRIAFTFEGLPGSTVPGLLAMPLNGTPPYPAMVFLHGVGQEKEFLDEIAAPFCQEGFAIATFDQLLQGERKMKGAHPLVKAYAMYRRGSLTVNEARRLTDYLVSRPDIDPNRLYLIGASYGAVTGAIAAAFDDRFKAVCLVYGGGDFSKWIARSKALPHWVSAMGGGFAAWLARPMDPIYTVGRISPRPILCLNGEKDRIVPPVAAQALFDAANGPKLIKWYPSDHLDLDPEYIAIAVKDGVAWFLETDKQLTAGAPS